MPRKVFVAGEILTAADVNTNLMDQAVMVFDDATDRATAIPTPVEGMVTYLKDDDEVTVFDGSAFKAVGPGKILQVVSTVKTDTFTKTGTGFADLTGLSASITPSTASSKVLVMVDVRGSNDSGNNGFLKLLRGSTDIYVGASAGSRTPVSAVIFGEIASMDAQGFTFLDSPSTTSAATYKVQVASNTSGTIFINRRQADGDDASTPRGVSSITLMEVAG